MKTKNTEKKTVHIEPPMLTSCSVVRFRLELRIQAIQHTAPSKSLLRRHRGGWLELEGMDRWIDRWMDAGVSTYSKSLLGTFSASLDLF